jgi:hypothetical protein
MNIFDLADLGLDLLIVVGVPAYVILQVWALVELPGGWRYAGLLPPALALSIVASCFDALSAHAAPPVFAIVFFAPAAALYLATMGGLSALLGRFDWASIQPAEAGAA